MVAKSRVKRENVSTVSTVSTDSTKIKITG
jgi:hypothetical protein